MGITNYSPIIFLTLATSLSAGASVSAAKFALPTIPESALAAAGNTRVSTPFPTARKSYSCPDITGRKKQQAVQHRNLRRSRSLPAVLPSLQKEKVCSHRDTASIKPSQLIELKVYTFILLFILIQRRINAKAKVPCFEPNKMVIHLLNNLHTIDRALFGTRRSASFLACSMFGEPAFHAIAGTTTLLSYDGMSGEGKLLFERMNKIYTTNLKTDDRLGGIIFCRCFITRMLKIIHNQLATFLTVMPGFLLYPQTEQEYKTRPLGSRCTSASFANIHARTAQIDRWIANGSFASLDRDSFAVTFAWLQTKGRGYITKNIHAPVKFDALIREVTALVSPPVML